MSQLKEKAVFESLRLIYHHRDVKSEGLIYHIKVALHDSGNNGHDAWSLTSEVYDMTLSRHDKCVGGGANHEDILHVVPEFQCFADLHLSDADGIPMYALENGWYHLMNTGVAVAAKYLRVEETVMQLLYDEIQQIENSKVKDNKKRWFEDFVEAQVPRWKAESDKALEYLKSLIANQS